MVGKINFLKRLTIFTAILGVILYLAQQKFGINNLCWLSLAYCYVLTNFTFYIANSGIKKDNKTFLTRTYSTIGIRLIFTIFPLFIYLLFSKVKELPLVISYILMYFFYTSFEIYHFVVNLRPDLNQK